MQSAHRLAAALAGVAALVLAACSSAVVGTGEQPLTVYATTGYLADAVATLAPEAEVTTMVGPGGDPHTYQPSTQDIETIQDSDLVLWNGLHLEAHMDDLLESRGEQQLAVGELLPTELLLDWPERDDQGNALHDPHVWNSPEAWSLVVGYIADKLSEVDPEGAEQYARNAAAYQEEIEEAAEEAEELLESVPQPRILITGHDAFNYFGQTYDLEVHATDFVSTDAALSPTELSGLADLIAENEVPVIFQDNQANPQAITSLQEAVQARGWQVEVSEQELYADSLGSEPGLDTYLGVFLHNAEAVAEALGGEQR
ncbi:MAG TPA: metal ABC transporter substrate-binding protein [Candidatus Brachybacterium merdavium]|uniref:Metal ABC transporter substrate-binding protein n=1 Tax=Candidatus Brachybacterium merdavium TaxID=2838513 RepID=A0A9D2RNM9_9MICO|nr:metal ABC transporter substrate-binding protein [Candidatus Brachybacterium merdavium]